MLERAIMTTPIVNPGLAGAPLFERDGRLVGLVSLGLTSVGRYSLAIPIEQYLPEGRAGLESGAPQRTRAPARLGGLLPAAQRRARAAGHRGGAGRPRRPRRPGARRRVAVPGRRARGNAAGAVHYQLWKKQPGEAVQFQVLRESSIRVVDVVSGDRYEFFR